MIDTADIVSRACKCQLASATDRVEQKKSRPDSKGLIAIPAGKFPPPMYRGRSLPYFCTKNSDIEGALAAAPGGLDNRSASITVRSML